MTRELWLATSNKGKWSEVRDLLQEACPGVLLKSLVDHLPSYSSPPETGSSFLENARIKARSLRAVVSPSSWVMADDSGLCVEGLGGLPGVHSARYAGPKASDSENMAKLLKMLQVRGGSRSAFYQCTLVVYSPEGVESVFEGRMDGEILRSGGPRGNQGFGYDPIFVPLGQAQTMGELGPSFKRQHSHRAQALNLFLRSWVTA